MTESRFRSAGLEAAVILGLFFSYLASFDLSSPVNGPYEVFAQDSVYILEYLAKGKPYRWNPQSHILYHHVVERGYELWSLVFEPGLPSAYRYLKWLTALTGLGFLAGLRWLFRELGLSTVPRIVLLLLAGVSVSAWFHFSAFETHCLAMPALALYLVALVRLRDRASRTLGDRAMLIGSLLVCGWTRVDLLRIGVVSALWIALPALRRHRRALTVDLALAAVLWAAGNAWLAHTYFDEPISDAATYAFERDDRSELASRLGRFANLAPRPLLAVARAVSLYGIVMPVEARPAGRSFFAPPSYELALEQEDEDVLPSTGLFVEPARNMLGTALSLVALVGVGAMLAWAFGLGLERSVAGDGLHATLVAQIVAGWLFYTWFNPFEPFLWILEFMPLWIAMIADHSRRRGRLYWTLLGLLAAVVAAHNAFAFYLPFR